MSPESSLVSSSDVTRSDVMEQDVIQLRPLSHPKRSLWRRLSEDPWLLATLVVACVASVAALWYFFQNNEILLTGDTYAHLLIARRLFDSLTPGIAQIGGIWLPLPHILLLPFVWNDYLWRTGLAGSFAAMPCYVVSSVYIFLAARRLTHNSRASFVGALLFMVNPNILYLQTTPLSELVLIVTLTMASYYFLAWAQEDDLKYLIWAAASTFLATLARYDAWVVFLALLVCIVIIGLLRRHNRSRIEGNLLIFAVLGGLGIVLWALWCMMIFGDPLYFQHSAFSSQAQQQSLINLHLLFTYHDLWQSIRTYAVDAALNVGPVLFGLGVFAVLCFYVRRRLTPEMVAASVFLVPFAFYVVSLYTGQAALFVPGASPAHAPSFSMTFYNTRYGVQMVAPAALFLATLVSQQIVKRVQWLLQIVLVIVILGQAAATASSGIISLQDGQYGLDCAPLHPIVVYLAQHYAGGKILADTFTSGTNALGLDVGVEFKDVIYEGSADLWTQALANPESTVEWIVMNPNDPNDLVTKHIHSESALFQSQFTRVVQEQNGLSLFHRNGSRPLPTRPVPPGLLSEHRLCGATGPQARVGAASSYAGKKAVQ
ncbi:MAG TPA: glycosyltransferase family 39 protein [Ktedonosporobacter sp.]|nr:glycosyltransferase family 39 protein [Ktedonosporobacter sp.]